MTSSQTFIDQELAQFGWVESIATNSITDFKLNKSHETQAAIEKKSDLVDVFICHLIFYMIFCYSLCLYILIDLGVNSFIKNKVNALIKVDQKRVLPSFPPIYRT